MVAYKAWYSTLGTTGLTPSLRIRRVKCDETKPACQRCTSTGRTCDGYDSEATASRRPNNQLALPSRGLPVANSSSLSPSSTPTPYWQAAAAASAASAPGLRTIRPSPPDIDGTELERSYFHEFRQAAEEGFCQHVANETPFWTWTVPYLCIQEPAVRHAIVALGAALRGYRLAEPRGSSTSPSRMEVFTLDQYGQAMTLLRQANGEAAGVTATTLVCCLAFVMIECLRGNWEDALQHLRAGLAIVDSTIPLEDLIALADQKGSLPGRGQLAGDTDYVVRKFVMLELSACLFQEHFQPVIALKLLRARRGAAKVIQEPRNVGEAHRATTQFCRDVCASAWEWNAGAVSPAEVARGREELVATGQRLGEALSELQEGTGAPKRWNADDTSLKVDMLHAACCRQLARVTAGRAEGPQDEAGYEEIARFAESVKRGVAAMGPDARERRFVLDVGTVAPMHFVVYNCGSSRTRDRALAVLNRWARRETFWDGPEVFALLSAGEAGAGLPKVVSGGPSIPALRDKLGRLSIGEGWEDGLGKERGKGKGKGKE